VIALCEVARNLGCANLLLDLSGREGADITCRQVIAVEKLVEIFAMTARHQDVYRGIPSNAVASHCRNQSEAIIAVHRNLPGEAKRLGRSHSDSNAGKASGADIDINAIRLAALGEGSDQW